MTDTDDLKDWLIRRYLSRNTEEERQRMRRLWGALVPPDLVIVDDPLAQPHD